MVDKKFIKNLQGKDFVTHEGLLNEFHKKGGVEITTELISSDGGVYIFKATAIVNKCADGSSREEPLDDYVKKFTAHGDASKENVSSFVVKHFIRMAETRAVNRAMRLATNIGMCSVDEVSETKSTDEKLSLVCVKCGTGITGKVSKFSRDKFGKCLCMDCQKKEK